MTFYLNVFLMKKCIKPYPGVGSLSAYMV